MRAKLGVYGIDLIGPKDWPMLKKYGLIPTMSPGGGTIRRRLQQSRNPRAVRSRRCMS